MASEDWQNKGLCLLSWDVAECLRNTHTAKNIMISEYTGSTKKTFQICLEEAYMSSCRMILISVER